ncbi:MAG: glycosyltransferase family 4 protein [Candidatus Brennerbacteria bacterium]|nr:glycosyltransferase family 4 protein [Candidatus Brennerbacteria bacterium]
MRIVFVSRSLPYLGGREVIVERLMEKLKYRHHILLLTPDAGLKRRGIKVVNINKNLKRIVGGFRPDIISCHTFYFFNLAYKLSRALDVPLITTFHGMFLRLYGKDYRSIIRNICEKSFVVTVVSRNYKEELIRALRVSRAKISVIKNGIPKGEVSRINKNIFKLKNYIPLDKTLVVVPARTDKIKGLEYLIGVAKKIKNGGFFFLVCSPIGRHNNWEKLFMKKLVELAPPKDVIDFREYAHSDLQKLFHVCDICLLPSLMEGVSISILEAMEKGCIVITTNVGGSPEVIKNGVNGYLIEPRNVKEIVHALERCTKLTKFTREKIKNNARKTVQTRFSEEKMLKSYEDLFLKVIKRHENKQRRTSGSL